MAKKLNHIQQYRLSYRLVLYLLSCSILFSFITSWYQLSNEYQNDLDTIAAGVSHIEEGYLKSLAISMWELNDHQLKTQLQGALFIPDVVHLTVKELRGEQEVQVVEVGTERGSGVIEYAFSLVYGDGEQARDIGKLYVSVDASRVKERLKKRVFLVFISQLVQIFMLALVVITIFQKMVMKHINTMAEYMQKFEMDKLHVPLKLESKINKPDSYDALTQVSSAINGMRQRIIKYIKERDKAENELLKAHDELEMRVEERTREVKEKQLQLAHAGRLAALGELSTGIAHELGQPLQIIKSAAAIVQEELASDTMKPDEIIPISQKILTQVDRAHTIISNMRTFARYDESKEPALIDIAVPLTECLGFFEEQFRQHQIALNLEIKESLPKIRTDFQKFQQIVVNLLSNARYAIDHKDNSGNDAEKKIDILLFKDTDSQKVILEITDNGLGMSEEDLQRCLEPFFTTKEVGKGTGLGLSISYGLMKEFNFELKITSTLGTGSTFQVLMPTGKINK